MAWSQEMKNLAAEIKTGHKDRATRIGEIKGETKDILSDADAYMKKVAADLKEAAKDLRDFLAKSEDTRKKDFNVLYAGIQDRIKDIKGEVRNFLSESEEKRMAGFNGIMKDIRGDLGAMKRSVTELLKSTKDLIGGYAAERKEAAGYWGRLGGKGEVASAEEAAPKPRKKGRPRRNK